MPSPDVESRGESKSEMPPVKAEASPAVLERRRRRLWLFRILALSFVLVGQEVLFRFLFPLPEVNGFNRIHYQQMAQVHPQLGKAMKRGLVYDRLLLESRPDGFSKVHNLNLYGFRGPDFAIEPSAGRRRILVIGDSVTEGQGANDGTTITAEWSRILKGEGTAAEVVNLGVIAASLPHLAILTRDAVSLLRPTDVVIVLYANDLPAPAYSPVFDTPGKPFASEPGLWWRPRLAVLTSRAIFEEPIYRRWFHLPVQFFAPVPDSTNPWTSRKGRPENLAPALYDDMVAGRLNPWLYFQSADMPVALAHDFAQGGSPIRFLEGMDEVCRRNHARLVLAYVPFCGVIGGRYASSLVEMGMDRAVAEALATDPKYRRQNRFLADLCRYMELPLADATADLEKAEAAGSVQFWRYDTHPNADGYATIARRIHAVWRDATGGGSKGKN
ncbi:MAG: SGNH/GDSL hydrolase family protein [Paludisphaera borealis]|uniref:SGNH/GDSL hydrolase family protein n=1 Tax=Paludisphaera borealis TaxID=1387353 RepID=UPI002840673E|nr:SGNH/GDSL hydrolase family protein [Paludisphaera borealis]MDR3620591.1 SGNH/GDSL hydrolase family protein [Paludisphaera borealis]